MLKCDWELFAQADAPPPVIRINWSSSFYYPLNYREGFTTICSNVEEAGAEAIICSLFLEEKDTRQLEVNNVELFSEFVRQKEKPGIPLIGECCVVEHPEKTPQQVHDKVERISRIMAELGADSMKTFFTGDSFQCSFALFLEWRSYVTKRQGLWIWSVVFLSGSRGQSKL